MKVTAFVGSARKKHTYNAVEHFLGHLKSYGPVECEIVSLSDCSLEICLGCALCCNRGEELCPLKDDRDELLAKIAASDGIIFATPNYSFNVSGLMKVFMDRLGFLFHRPRFFGKAFTGIVAQGIYGGNKIVDYFNFVGRALGCNVVKGSCITTLEPITESGQAKINRIIEAHSKKFYSTLIKKELPVPTLFELMLFRVSRSSIKRILDESWADYRYYKAQGWFESDYFYPTRLNPIKKLAGKIFDRLKF